MQIPDAFTPFVDVPSDIKVVITSSSSSDKNSKLEPANGNRKLYFDYIIMLYYNDNHFTIYAIIIIIDIIQKSN